MSLPSSDLKTLPGNLEAEFKALKETARLQRRLPAALKMQALLELADHLLGSQAEVLKANAQDLKNLTSETTPAFRDRMTLNTERIAAMTESLRQVARLPDPVGEIVDERTLANGLRTRRVRSPLGVLLMIFESRPNVILEAFSLAFKSGNVIALRGGSESKQTAQAVYSLMVQSLKSSGVQAECFLGIQDYDRAIVETLLKRKDLIDIVVPRGGDRLIEYVQKTSLMPIIKNDRGLCHAFIAADADLDMAVKIVANGKMQRPGVCNSLETVLVDQKIAAAFLNKLYALTESQGLQWHGDAATVDLLKGKARVRLATEEDWDTEYLALILNARVVSGLPEALRHIEKHSSKHSEVIVTQSETMAREFQDEVDAAAVYWNASSRFTDGFELGLGGELGISTQKLHVRGPVGLRELTTPRWICDGTGQIRS